MGRGVRGEILVSAGGVVRDGSLSCMWQVSSTAVKSLVEEVEVGEGERET